MACYYKLMLISPKCPKAVITSITSLSLLMSVTASPLAGTAYAQAATSPVTTAQTEAGLAQSFAVDGKSTNYVAGSLVSSVSGKRGTVELSSVKNTGQLVGIVADEPLVTIVDSTSTVSVVINGKATVLVSDINGSLKAGDKVTASPIAGIGMKATLSSQIVGTVQTDQSSDKTTITRSVKDTDGQPHTIKISRLPIQLGVAYYQSPGSSYVPPIVQRTANNIAGQPVSLIRTLASVFVLIVSVASVVTLLYSAGRNSIIAIGRNPLSSKLVYKGMYRVGVLALIILVFGTTASILLLKL